MRKQSILCLAVIMLVLLCSCSGNDQGYAKDLKNINYKEASIVDYNAYANNNSVLMFKSYEHDEKFGELYIKTIGNDAQKISDNVEKNCYGLLNNNNVYYIDDSNALYYKKSGHAAIKIADNVPFSSINTGLNGLLCYTSYDSELMSENSTSYKSFILDTEGNSALFYEGTINSSMYDYIYNSFCDNGEYLFELNNLGALYRVSLDGNKDILAGNVRYYDYTPDGSAFAYNNYNDRLYIKWSGAEAAIPVKSINVSENCFMADNGLSCVFSGYEDDGSNVMFVSPFNEPASILESDGYFTVSSNNEYLYILENGDELYGCKLPRITPESDADEIKSSLENTEKVLIYKGVEEFEISADGRSVAFILNDGLYTSYDFAEAVKVKENVTQMAYIGGMLIFTDESNLYVNTAYGSKEKFDESTKLVTDNLESFYRDNIYFDRFFYVNNDSSIYLYTLKDGAELIIKDPSEYYSVEYNNIKLYTKKMSIDDIMGKYRFENSINYFDSGIIEISDGYISLINESGINSKDVDVLSEEQNSISLCDGDSNKYNFYMDNNNMQFELYDVETDSYYQYSLKALSDKEYNERKENLIKIIRDNAVYDLLEGYYYEGYLSDIVMPIYLNNSLTSEMIGNTVEGEHYDVLSYYVEENNNIWLNIEFMNSLGYDYGWIFIDTSNIEIID